MNELLTRLNREVGEEYGRVLPLKIVDTRAPNFDWNTVNIPMRLNHEKDERLLKNILRHEYGHLFINPKSLAVGETMFYLAKSVGFRNPQMAVNIVSDLIVDSSLMAMHGSEYLYLLEHYLVDKSQPPLKLMGAFYAAHARVLGIPTKLTGSPYGNTLYTLLMNATVPFYQRVYSALMFLHNHLGNELALGGHSIVRIVINGVNESNVRRELEKHGVILNRRHRKSSITFHIPGFTTHFRVLNNPEDVAEVEMDLESLYELDELGGSRKMSYGTWNPGDSVSAYDALKTIENTGVAVPGITTVSKIEKRAKGANGPRDIVVVLDCSGSMRGMKFRAAQVAVLNILRNSERAGIRVGFVPFAGEIDENYIIYPTANYAEIRDLLLRIMPDGGTVLGTALKRAAMMSPGRVYIITDSHISDTERVLSQLGTLEKVVFVISDGEKIESWVHEADRFYVVSPRDLIVISKEVI